MKDPYETLGVNRSATDKEIKDAFKKLARKFHPDLHPNDKEAEGKFKDISAANDLLKDAEKRRRFDAGEIDASGAERPQERFYRDFADGPAYASHAAQDGFANNEELQEFLARAFADRGRRSQGTFRARGQDVSYVLPVGFLEVANGAARTITLPEGKTLQVTIPEGAEDRQMLRLKGQGMPGFGGGPAGDAYVELHVEPHPFFHRKDDNIHVEVPVTLKEAALGARIEVPTVPEHIRSDNGAEMTAKVVRNWLTQVGAKTLFIELGSPWENGYCESFNGKLRDELLNGEIFCSLKEAQIVIEQWRKHYNTVRPHSALGYRPPAPQTFAPSAAHLDEIVSMQ